VLFLGLLLRLPTAEGAGVVCDLSACLDVALERHPALKLAKAQQATAQATVSGEQSAFWPTLSLSVNAGLVYGEPASPFVLARSITVKTVDFFGSYYSLDVEYRHPFYKEGVFFGKDAPSVQEAEGALRASAYASRVAAEQVRYEVSEAYFNALRKKEAIQVGEDVLKSRQADYEAAQKRFAQRLLTQSDLLLTETKRQAAQNDLEAAKREWILALTDLTFKMGLPPDTAVEVHPASSPPSVLPPLDALTALAYRDRAEIAAQEAAVQNMEATQRLAQAERLPTLELISGYSIGDDYSPPGNTSWVTAFRLEFPLQNLHASRVKQAQAEAKQMEQEQKLLHLRHTVASEVIQAYHEIARFSDAARLSEKQIEQAEQAVAQVRSQLKASLVTQSALFEAEAVLSQSRQSRVQTQYDQQIAHAKLRKAVGGEWQP
jgi:outer membrane protein TolC